MRNWVAPLNEAGMKLKSYQSNSVEAAIRLAKVELGEDAIFMGSRENGSGDESGARFEVTFAVSGGDAEARSARNMAPRPNGASQSGTPRFSRPAWAGLARRARGMPEQALGVGLESAADSKQPRRSPAAALRRHWRDFVPADGTVPRSVPQRAAAEAAQPARPEAREASGSVKVPEAPLRLNDDQTGAEPSPVPGRRDEPAAPIASARLFAVMERLSGEARRLRALLGERESQKPALAVADRVPERVEGMELLISQGMCAAAARSLIEEALHHCSRPVSPQRFQQQLEISITKACRVDATLGRQGSESEPAIALFVGPAGVGKTSAICKLAIRLGLEAERPVHLFSLDTFRLGAEEQLASFADLLQAPFTAVEACDEAVEAVRRAAAGAKGPVAPLILIDTPGYGPGERKQARALARELGRLAGLDTHLVLPATSSEGHLRRSLEAFGIFRPRKLLVTKLDECGEAGAIVGETVRCRLPISYFSTGQRIPEDITAASSERLACQLLQAF